MKKCDYCKKDIHEMNYIQVTFLGETQRIAQFFRRPIQLEFCSFNCFQEYFNLMIKEQAIEEERVRQEKERQAQMKT